MKIMFYIGSLNKGGAERVVCNLSNYFVKENDVSIITTIDSKSAYKLDKKIKLFSLSTKKDKSNIIIKNVNYLKRLKKIIKKENPDIVLSFLPEPCYRTLMIKRSIKVPVIISVRNDPKIEYKNLINRIMMKVFYKKADGFVFQTTEARDFFSQKIKDKSVIIANPIEEHFFKEKYFPSNEMIFTNVGRLNEQKNQLFLIKCFEKVIVKYPNVKLYIYGEGNLRNDLESYINDNELNNNVILRGNNDNIAKELNDKFAFILSSKYEGMPNALMEAMTIGLPCISTDCPCGGPREIINNNFNGILVENENEEKMVEAIFSLIEDDKKREKLIKNSKNSMNKFKPELICNEWFKFICEVCNNEKNN